LSRFEKKYVKYKRNPHKKKGERKDVGWGPGGTHGKPRALLGEGEMRPEPGKNERIGEKKETKARGISWRRRAHPTGKGPVVWRKG